MKADDTEQIKRRIKEHLRTIPKYKITCDYCKKFMCYSTYFWEGYHYDCYKHLLWVIITQEKRNQAAIDLKSSS